MPDPNEIYFVTRYALTSGIKKVEATPSYEGKMISVVGRSHEIYHQGDFYSTLEAAVARADQMRVAKIASLKKSIAKLEKLTFQAAPLPEKDV